MINFSQDDDHLRLLNEIDAICDCYEAAWKKGEQPVMEDFLANQREELQIDLIPQLLDIDVAYRRKMASTISLEAQETAVAQEFISLEAIGTPPTSLFEFSESLPSQFHYFELLELVGRGATSSVFKARDTRDERSVALKICHPFIFEDRIARLRFFREAEIVADLRCNGIVRIQEFGCHEGNPYLVMELVEGESLSAILKRGGLWKDFQRTARVVADAARALHHAHEAGIIHRDIKPSNLLIPNSARDPGSRGSKSNIMVVDFGLAQKSCTQTQMTRTGEILGTPSYMSPEAIANGAHETDARSDIYGLGVVLYQLLTGRVPFAKPMPAILHQILLQEPTPPRQIDESIPRALELICLKCLDKNPRSRIQTARALADELERWLAGEAIATRPEAMATRAWKLVLRHRTALFGASVVGAALMLVLGMGFLFWSESRQARNRTANELVAQLVQCDSASFPRILARVQTDNVAASLINAQLRARNLSASDELRLRLALPDTRLSDLAQVIQYIATESKAEEFAEVHQRFGEETLKLISQIEAVGPDLKRVEFEFRKGLLTQRTNEASEGELRICSALAGGLMQLEIPERIAPWIRQIGVRKKCVSLELTNSIKSTTHEVDQLAACYALTELHRGELEELAPLLEFLEGKAHQELFEALRHRSTTVVPILEKRAARNISGHATSTSELTPEARWRNASRLVTALLRLESKRGIELLEKTPANEPRLTTYFAVSAKRNGLELSEVEKLLRGTQDARALRALVLAIGEFSQEAVEKQPSLRDWLKKEYADHPSSAVHAAIRWVLRTFNEEQWLRNQDRQMSVSSGPDKEWFVNSQGITMVILPQQGFPIPLAMSMEEITLEEFRAFRPQHQLRPECLGTSGLHPVTNVSVRDALSYCIWLSNGEGIDPTEQAVQLTPDPERIDVDLTRTGYRLPSMVELRLAGQAGAATWRFCGDKETPFAERFIVAGGLRSSLTVGQRMPNSLGLFDMLGNVYDLTIDKWHNVEHDKTSGHDLGLNREVDISMPVRTLGGDFGSRLDRCQSVIGSMTAGNEGLSHVGFRIVCRAPTLNMSKRD
jgi:formylglycine-generating enzyme required for sulfatase activity/tRNA A-37 threonylcarbamoyl transferase component Bud32